MELSKGSSFLVLIGNFKIQKNFLKSSIEISLTWAELFAIIQSETR